MHAGRDEYHEGGFIYFGDPRTIKMYDVEPVEVELTENPEGSYYGWLETGEDIPVMIQPHIHMYNIQFAYGPEAEIRRRSWHYPAVQCRRGHTRGKPAGRLRAIVCKNKRRDFVYRRIVRSGAVIDFRSA